MQQKPNKQTGTCKICKQKIQLSEVVQHAYYCQQKQQTQILQMPKENTIKQEIIQNISNQQQQHEIHQEQIIQQQEQLDKQDKTVLVNQDIQEQNTIQKEIQNTIQKEISNNNQKEMQNNNQKEVQNFQDQKQIQCNFCSKSFQTVKIEQHYEECESLFKVQQMQFEMNSQQEDQIEDKQNEVEQNEVQLNNQSEIHDSNIEDGLIRRTRIKRDQQTGFTHYFTNFIRNPNDLFQMPIRNPNDLFQMPIRNPNDLFQMPIRNIERPPIQNDQEFTVTKFEFKDHPNLSEEYKKCIICLNEFEQREMLSVLPCMHRFHDTCIDEWLNKQNQRNCPICKLDLEGF